MLYIVSVIIWDAQNKVRRCVFPKLVQLKFINIFEKTTNVRTCAHRHVFYFYYCSGGVKEEEIAWFSLLTPFLRGCIIHSFMFGNLKKITAITKNQHECIPVN